MATLYREKGERIKWSEIHVPGDALKTVMELWHLGIVPRQVLLLYAREFDNFDVRYIKLNPSLYGYTYSG